MPLQDFDHTMVRGRLIKLFQINKNDERFAKALETVAGSKLYSIVVDNDVVCSLLMKHQAFKKYRVDLIPNNRIKGKEPTEDVLKYVRTVTKGRARPAIELIAFNPALANSMKYVFANTLVCEDSDTAKKLAFDPYVRMKTVTIEGDVYQPNGVLTGGYTSNKYGRSLLSIK